MLEDMVERDEKLCLARGILDRIADKWTLNVVHQLAAGPRRFMELHRAVPGISQRMLTVTLRGLEENGLVARTVHPVVPPRVDYELTDMGCTLHETIKALVTWTEEHQSAIAAARAEYDARTARDKELLER